MMSKTFSAWLVCGCLTAGAAVAAGLVRIDGEAEAPGLSAEASIERDELGAVRIIAASKADAMYALGFAHGQDRFFQMDGMRRLAAGRTAELAGPSLLETDKRYRVYGFEGVAAEVVERLPARHREMLEAYTRGVNAGVGSLASPPMEYALLSVEPEAWRVEDCVLVSLAMHDTLNFTAWSELERAWAREVLAPEVEVMLYREGSSFDALLIGQAAAAFALPGPDVIDVRKEEESTRHRGSGPNREEASVARMSGARDEAEGFPGSNNWAVAGSRTADGRAIMASDPHLGIMLPPTWYRAELRWGDERWVGVSLPGVPGIVMGSNGRIAWSTTNSGYDQQDHVIVEVVEDDEGRYRVPGGDEAFVDRVERIVVRGGEDVETVVRATRWGPVVDERWQWPGQHGRTVPLALRWTALEPEMISFALFDLMEAGTLEDGLRAAQEWWGPSQSVVVATDDGRVGWTLSGWLPERVGFGGEVPVSWASGERRWEGQVDASQRPMLVDPLDGAVYTANNRLVPDAPPGGFFAHGARAARIRDVLLETPVANEAGMARLQNDVRAIRLEPWREVVLAMTAQDGEEVDPLVRAGREAIDAWDGEAGTESAGFALLRQVRAMVTRRALRPAREAVDGAGSRAHADAVALDLLRERPMHLLDPEFASWEDLVEGSLRESVLQLRERHKGAGGERVEWGKVNRVGAKHVLADLPMMNLMDRLRAPRAPLAGDWMVVRVATPSYGASMRMVVSPGREEDGLFAMPGGQSGHPAAEEWLEGHAVWVEGGTVPLLPGEAVGRLVLRPVASAGAGGERD
jgi:penicillin G amidase